MDRLISSIINIVKPINVIIIFINIIIIEI